MATLPVASNALSLADVVTPPSLSATPSAVFWSFAQSGTGPGGYSIGGFSLNGASVLLFSGGLLSAPFGWDVVDGVYIAPGITLSAPGTHPISLAGASPAGVDFNLGVYAGYFASTTSNGDLENAIAALANIVEGA